MKEENHYCTDYPDVDIISTTCRHNCRYNRTTGLHYNKELTAPKGMCMDAFNTAYNYCLTILYDGNYGFIENGSDPFRIKLKCPSYQNFIVIEISQTIFPFKPFFRALESLFHMIRKPIEIIDREILIEIKDVKGECPHGHRVREVFKFNIGNSPELCPASFYSLFPYLKIHSHLAGSKASMPDLLGIAQCPDHKGKITFELYNRYVDITKVKTFKKGIWGLRSLTEPVLYVISNKIKGLLGSTKK